MLLIFIVTFFFRKERLSFITAKYVERAFYKEKESVPPSDDVAPASNEGAMPEEGVIQEKLPTTDESTKPVDVESDVVNNEHLETIQWKSEF